MTDRGSCLFPESKRGPRGRRARRLPSAMAGFAVLCLVGALGATLVAPPRPLLIWNVSRSAPIGLYRVEAAGQYSVGDMVAARVPVRWRPFGGARHYIPVNVPLIKRIAAAPADRVCADGAHITIDGRLAARRRARDGAGRKIPGWTGCVNLQTGEHLLLMEHAASFDGRYFGATAASDIIGRVQLIWPR